MPPVKYSLCAKGGRTSEGPPPILLTNCQLISEVSSFGDTKGKWQCGPIYTMKVSISSIGCFLNSPVLPTAVWRGTTSLVYPPLSTNTCPELLHFLRLQCYLRDDMHPHLQQARGARADSWCLGWPRAQRKHNHITPATILHIWLSLG